MSAIPESEHFPSLQTLSNKELNIYFQRLFAIGDINQDGVLQAQKNTRHPEHNYCRNIPNPK